MFEFLEAENIDSELLRKLRAFQEEHHPLLDSLRGRIPAPHYHYYGKDIWEQAAAALLCGKNLLLAGGKATGKNVLAENLAAVFGRPAWNVSFHVNMDAAGLIGMDAFENGQVRFRPGPIYQCVEYGGFAILDEINMAKNEVLAVLHSVLDFRRVIDVPGYDRIPMEPSTRFIATMNYGYAGTQELNEALTSRFSVIQMPTISPENLDRLFAKQCPSLKKKYREQFAQLFLSFRRSARARRSPPRLWISGACWMRWISCAQVSPLGQLWIWVLPTKPLTATNRA